MADIKGLPHTVEAPQDAEGMPVQLEGIQQNFDALFENDQALQDRIEDLEETVDSLESGSGITALTGDVTASGSGSVAATIANDAVTNAKAANMAEARIKGRAAGAGTGDPTDLTGTQATAILDAMVGDSGSGGTKGLAPAPAAGDAAAGKFLKADGTWAAPSGSGSGAPTNAEYLTAASNTDLSAERVATDHGATQWDFGTAAQAKLKVKKVIGCVIDGAGAEILTGAKGFIRIPWAATIQKVTVLADVTGDIVIDIWKDSYANFPPTVADTITAAAKPTITSGVKYEDSTLTGWTTSISAGDVLRFNVDSVTDITQCTIELEVLI
jgi:hypothetical protein